jgi:hypothetical protein
MKRKVAPSTASRPRSAASEPSQCCGHESKRLSLHDHVDWYGLATLSGTHGARIGVSATGVAGAAVPTATSAASRTMVFSILTRQHMVTKDLEGKPNIKGKGWGGGQEAGRTRPTAVFQNRITPLTTGER